MSDPTRQDMSRVEAWLRNHEEWPVPNDDLRAKIISHASSAQLQAKEKSGSQSILIMCIAFCGLVTWMLQDVAAGFDSPQDSALVAAMDEGWIRPIDCQVSYITTAVPRTGYDVALLQSHVNWRRWVYHRLSASLWQ